MSNNEKKYTNAKLNISSSLAELRSQLKSKIFRKMRYGMKRQIPIKNRNMQYWIPARFLINPMSGVPFNRTRRETVTEWKIQLERRDPPSILVSFFFTASEKSPPRIRSPFSYPVSTKTRFTTIRHG